MITKYHVSAETLETDVSNLVCLLMLKERSYQPKPLSSSALKQDSICRIGIAVLQQTQFNGAINDNVKVAHLALIRELWANS